MALSTKRASSSVPSALQWKHDVFLSFKDGGARNFASQLYEKLLEHGLRAFLDDGQLQIGRPISQLFSAIQDSRFAIIVISPDYASSQWCLNELSMILECMEVRGAVLPIFCSVEPSDVGDRCGSFGEAFTELEQKFKDDKEMVKQWKIALTKVSKLNGCTSKDRLEPELIIEIVEKVRTEVGPMSLEPAESDNRILQLHSELLRTTRGDLSVSDFLDKMNGIARNLALSGNQITESDLVTIIMNNVGPPYENIVSAHAQLHGASLTYDGLEALLLSAQSPSTTHYAPVAESASSSPAHKRTNDFVVEAAATSSATPKWKYDVFLSFRGEDTRKNFTGHIYAALVQNRISAFRDCEELEKGGCAIQQERFKAIEESNYVILVLSRNYACSTWCLDGLAKAVECMKVKGQKIFPVYYDVDPDEVRNQKGAFRFAFSKLEEALKDNIEKVQRWRAALTAVANITGWHLQDGYETKVIQAIVERIVNELNQTIPSVCMDLVGMDFRVKEMLSYLDMGLGGVRFIGIWGMAGIGKTTIARAVSERISAQFDAYSFLSNIREKTEMNGSVHLQEILLSDVLKTRLKIWSTDMGINVIRHRLRSKKVLIILDDVDKLEQVEALCGHSWFGQGSRVIITSRNEHLLNAVEVDKIYKVDILSDDEALQLFSWKAFRGYHVREGYLELSKKVLKYVNGLPLALVVFGSFLFGKSREQWSAVLDRLLERNPDSKIFDVIKISFDGLMESEKKIFLDIACFFKGDDTDRVTRILESCGLYPVIGIQVLIENALVTISGRNLWMHDLIQQVGWEIVRRECREPGRRSRLWLPSDIIHVLANNKGTDTLEGIALDFPKLEEVPCNPEAFFKMHNLRFLQIRNVNMADGPKYLSNALTCLEWSGYPTKYLPQSFQPEKLCELKLCYSSIEQLWNGRKYLVKLDVLDVSYSQNLARTPDFTSTPNLQTLVLEGCTNLREIDPSISMLKRLKFLNLKGCRSLESLPEKIEMECLEIFILSGCSNIKKIPEFEGNMVQLLELSLDETAIKELASSIGCLTGLTSLNLRDCKNLEFLPSGIGNLKSLKRLNICGCSKLKSLPESLGKIGCLEELDAGGTSISDLPSSISLLENIEVLSLCGCKCMPRNRAIGPIFNSGLRTLTQLNLSDCNLQEGTIPDNLGCLSSLVSLSLSKNSFVTLPKSIRQLSKLYNLNLESCKSLQKLPHLSEKTNFSVGADGGTSQSSCFNLNNCFQLVDKQGSDKVAFSMLRRFLQGSPYPGIRFEVTIPGSEISRWFRHQSVGPVVNMELPQDWYKHKWMGYALCAVFVIRRYLPVPAKHLGKWKHGTYNTAHGLRCEVKPNISSAVDWSPSLGCSEELGHIESDHLWLSFVCGEYFGTAWQENCRSLQILFKTIGTGLEVKKSGVRLIYEQDLLGIKP